MDAERYQEAYYSLVDEVGGLVDRNNLAEEEADRLSRFNAEILGHNNPAQRIMYVDRIRRELAETKHVRQTRYGSTSEKFTDGALLTETPSVDPGSRRCCYQQ